MSERYKANFNYFDKIDTPNKAYWLGFIWADGYIAKRFRTMPNGNQSIEYNLKLALKQSDAGHIQKFLNDIESNYPVKLYKSSGFVGRADIMEARTFITNLHMCAYLYEDLGIVPRRFDASKLIEQIPEEFHKYFILGLFDADGSFSAYQSDTYGKKMNVSFGGSEQILRFIEQHLANQEIIDKDIERKLYQRHKDKDGIWRTLVFSGKTQGMKILKYLYDSPIYLDRKYQKYLTIPYFQQ